MNRVSQAEFGRICGVNRSTVNRWVKGGRVTVGPDGLLDPEAAQRMRLATESPLPHHQARKAQFDEARVIGDVGEGAEAPPAGSEAAEEASSLEGVGMALKRATLAVQQRKAEILAMERDKMRGSLVERATVDWVLADIAATLLTLVETLPDRLAGELAQHRGDAGAIHKCLEDAGRELLLALNEQMGRRAQELGGAGGDTKNSYGQSSSQRE